MSEVRPSFTCYHCGTKQSVRCQGCEQAERERVKSVRRMKSAMREVHGSLRRTNRAHGRLVTAAIEAVCELVKVCDHGSLAYGVAGRLAGVLNQLEAEKVARKKKRRDAIEKRAKQERFSKLAAETEAEQTEAEQRGGLSEYAFDEEGRAVYPQCDFVAHLRRCQLRFGHDREHDLGVRPSLVGLRTRGLS